MKQTNTGCYGCKYNCNWKCVKEGACTGVIPYEIYASTASAPNYIPANISIMPDEQLVIELKKIKVLERALQLACEPRDDWGADTANYYEKFINQATAEIKEELNND